MKKTLPLLLFVAVSLASWADGFNAVVPSGHTLHFEITDSQNKKVSVNGSGSEASLSGNLVIPDSISDGTTTYAVTTIGESAFANCNDLNSITIPSSVLSIGSNAFRGVETVCYCGEAAGTPWGALRVGCFYTEGDFVFADNTKTTLVGYIGAGGRVTIPNTVTTIADSAFLGCTSLTALTIPNSVTTIGNHAFYGCGNLSHIIIPNSVTSIEEVAFSGIDTVYYRGSAIGSPWGADTVITNVYTEGVLTYESPYKTMVLECSHEATDVIIPNSVFYIENEAFSGCEYLTQLTIPPSVTYIGKYAFEGCRNMTILYYQAKNLSSTEDWYDDIYDCFTCGFRDMNLQMLVIGDSVETIPSNVFYRQYGLFSLTIPNSVTTIGNHAFANCGNLTAVTIPNSVTTVGDYAFSGCDSLKMVSIGESVTQIGDYAFEGCANVDTMYYNAINLGNTDEWDIDGYGFRPMQLDTLVIGNKVQSLPNNVFIRQNNLNSIIIPNSVISINDYAFSSCSSLSNVTFGDSVTTIGISAFDGCERLTGSLTIPYSVTTIGDFAFAYCSGLTNIIIGDSVTTIGESAFALCRGLKMVSIGESVNQIGDYSFMGCTNVDTMYYNAINLGNTGSWHDEGYGFQQMQLDTLVIGNRVQVLPINVFIRQNNLTSVTIPNSVTTIGDYAFSGCSSLTSVTIPNSVTTIGDYAFSGCSSLTSVTIGNSVTTIGEAAFYDCSSLTSVTIGSSVTTIGDFAFNNCIGLTSVTIPSSVTIIGNGAFRNCCNLASVTIPSSVTIIGESAFWNCRGLTSVTIPSSVTTIGDFAFYDGVETVIYCGEATGSPWGAQNVYGALRDSLYFQDCDMTIVNGYVKGLATANIPNTVTTIAENAFKNCSTITSVTLPESVTTIENYAFDGCSDVETLYYNAKNLTTTADWYNDSEDNNTFGFRPMSLQTLVIGDSVETLPAGVFYGQSDLTTLTIPSSMDTIENHAFEGCTNVTTLNYNAKNLSNTDDWYNTSDDYNTYGFRPMSPQTLVIGDSVETLPEGVFYGQSGITAVTIPSSVTSIGRNAFQNCSNLASATIGNSVTNIKIYTFDGCSSLVSVIIPNSVTTIGSFAFYHCTGLTSLTIPNSVTIIWDYAYEGCTNLKTIYNLSEMNIIKLSSDNGYVAKYANRVLSKDNGFTDHGTGSNTLHQIDASYTVVDAEDDVVAHIPVATIPANFIYLDGGSTKSASGWKANEVILTDGQDAFEAPETFTAGTATYTRNYTQDNRSTLCLPFKPTSVTPAGDLKFYEFSNFDGTTISFSEVAFTNLQANTPYMVEWSATKTKADFVFSATDATFPATGDAASRTVTHVTQDDSFVGKFVGTMTRTCMTSSNYGYSNGFFVQSAEGTPDVHTSHAHVNPFRAYFEITSGSGVQSLPPTLSVEFSEGDNIAIEEPQGPAQQSSSIRYYKDVYDLMGAGFARTQKTSTACPAASTSGRARKCCIFSD